MKNTKLLFRSFVIIALIGATVHLCAQSPACPLDNRYILYNGDQWNIATTINGVADSFPQQPSGNIRAGSAIIFYCMANDSATVTSKLNDALNLAQTRSVPVFICLDVEQWLQGHPELWNWFDPNLPGYDTLNKNNVEWFGWSPQQAIKISWRNWGGQARVLPAPNLMSPKYRDIIHVQFNRYIPIIMNWYNQLPVDKKYLFAGLKVGWESSIGTTNACYHSNGNYYKETWPNDPSNDPAWSYNGIPPNFGFQQIGYAALKTSGIKTSGSITEDDLATVIHNHLDDLTNLAASLGIPREKMFTHVQPGWGTGTLEYKASYTNSSCPGFSAYGFTDIRNQLLDRVGAAVTDALANGAPAWGIVEIPGGVNSYNWTYDLLHQGFAADPTCRLVNFYNWNDVVNWPNDLKAARDVMAEATVPYMGASVNVINPGFELDGIGAQNIKGWSTWPGSNGTDAVADFTESYGSSHSGSFYLKHWKGSAYEVSTYQVFTGLSNGEYTLTAWVTSSGGQTYCSMGAKNFDNAGTAPSVNIPTTNTWTKVSLNKIRVENNQCEIYFYSLANANDWFQVDDVNLTISTGPFINSASSANGTIGGLFSYTITASNSPTSFNATGLPAGLSVDTTNGVISGKPTTIGTYTVTVSATNCNGTDTQVLEVLVGITGLVDINHDDGNMVYPNPFSSNFNIIISHETVLKDAMIRIYDVCGKEVKRVSLNSYETNIERGELQSGLYLYTIFNNDQKMENWKLIVQ